MLLAASDLLGNPELAEPAYLVLDRFVSEQLETGNWSSSYFGKAACPLAESVRRAELSSNLADIGVMTGALATAAMRATGPRRSRYLLAARRYADQISLPNQLDTGAFPNLRYRGEQHLGAYSVATATQAASLAVLHAATGDPRYRDAALRAGAFLAAQCRAGSSLFFSPDSAKIDTIDAGRMGDLFYVLEGLLFTERIAVPPYREAIEEGLDRLLTSPGAILPFTDNPTWWVSADLWEQSKRGGLLYLLNLAESRRGGHRGEFEAAARRLLGCLADPSCGADLGILQPPSSPLGKFSMITTGLAGLGLVSYLDPGAIPRMSLPLTADR
jgi:hypothetical protein